MINKNTTKDLITVRYSGITISLTLSEAEYIRNKLDKAILDWEHSEPNYEKMVYT